MRSSTRSMSLVNRQTPVKSKWVRVLANGSPIHKRILISPQSIRCFDSLLNHLTDKLNPRFGAVRNIYTVDGERVESLSGLENEKTYICTGVEKCRPPVGARRNSRNQLLVGGSHACTGQHYTAPRRAPDGGDIGSFKGVPNRRRDRCSSKERLADMRSRKPPVTITQLTEE